MSYRAVLQLFVASWLLSSICPVLAEPEQTSWFVSITPTEESSTHVTDDNELRSTEADIEPTTTGATEELGDWGSTTLSDDITFTTLSTTDFVPGSEVTDVDKNPDALTNQVSDLECSLEDDEECSVVVSTLYVRSDIRYRYAKTVVYSKIANPANISKQATFSVMLPETAFISKFFIEVDSKKYEAYVKQKDQAEKEYQEALESGQTAAHVGVSARDSDVFVVSVNVAPRNKITFNLTYEELLSRRLSTYHHTISLTPNQIVKDVSVDVYIREIRNITVLNVSTSDDGKNLKSGGDDLLVEYLSSLSAHVYFKPKNEDDLKRFESGLQQLVIQYDVDRTVNPSGDIMLMDGYFVHYFAPEDVKPEPKHIVFALDTSGSMWGRKLQQVQQAMYSILDSLREDDYFSIVQFSTNVLEWSTQPQDMVGLSRYKVTHPVNEMNINKAKQFIKSMEASGGTNINGALIKALQLVAKQDYGTNGVEEAEEKHYIDSNTVPHPMVVFLTDGIATIGELVTRRILAQVRAVNTEIRVAIFSLAFGDGANYRFLKKLSLQNHGFARKIYESSDATLQLQSFYNEIGNPLLANVTFTYVDNKIDKFSLTTNQFHSYYGGSEIIVAGKLKIPNAETLDIIDLGAQVQAWSGAEHKEVLYKPEYTSDKTQIHRRRHEKKTGTLERLWAYLTVRQLLDQHIASTDDNEVKRPTVLTEEKETQIEHMSAKTRALELSLKYGFVTPLTSLVVVIPKNGSGTEVSEMVKHPIGNNILEPAPFQEITSLQNKIIPVSFLPRPPALTARPFTTAVTSPQTTPIDDQHALDLIDIPRLTNYTLGDISWLLDYFDSEDRLLVETTDNLTSKNETYLVTGLILTSEVPDTRDECTTADGEPGSCRIMSTCVQSDFIDDYQMFLSFFCPIGKLAGVCCPNSLLGNNTSTLSTEASITTTAMG